MEINRIKDKITEIGTFLTQLEEVIMPRNYEEYSTNFKTKAASERYFEKIIEAVVDLCFLIIKDKNLTIPEDDKNAFDILQKHTIINENTTKKLKAAKGMRNILAHEYGKVDDELVFNAIHNELINDVNKLRSCHEITTL
jgi:uncharacterized protein YutE (UPF0331/DUF86 family)